MKSYRSGWMLTLVLALLFAPPGEAAAQATGTITGRVTSSDGQPLVAAQVGIPGSLRGTVTGDDGTFTIAGVPAGQVQVRASVVGYGSSTQAVTVAAGATATVNFTLNQAVVNLDAIVVTGMAGETTKAKLPISVEKLDAEALPVPATNAGSLLVGKAAGVQVTGGSGRPGAAPSILLRAPTSINASGRDQEPLYIVDGVILASSIADIDAMDIESIEIVKGAAGASMYGSRAANGVIQITTKRGKNAANNSVRYSVRSEFGGSDLPGRFNLTQKHHFRMNDAQTKFISSNGECDFALCSNVSLAGQRALPGATVNGWNTIQQEAWPGQTYDHVERFFRGGEFMRNSVSISGRSDATNYFISYNGTDETGVMPGHEGRQSHSIRLNVDQSVREDVTVSASASYSRSRQNTDDGALFALTRMPAGVDLMAEDPNNAGHLILKPDPFNDNANPLVSMLEGGYSESVRGRFLGSATASWTPLEWFKADAQVAYDRLDANSEGFTPKGFRTLSQPLGTGGDMSRGNTIVEGLNASVMGQITRSIGDLASTTQVRYLIERQDRVDTDASGSEFTVDGVWTIDNTPDNTQRAGSAVFLTRSDGFFLIQNLDFRDRYILDGMIRQDGSSRFGPESRREWYYRVAGAYRITEEPWFYLPFLDELKLRASIGTAGNTPGFSSQYETYSVGNGTIGFGVLGNRNLKPEVATEREFGIETVGLGGRVSLDLTYANSDIENQLLSVPLRAFEGFPRQWRNAGSLASNTFEATLSAELLRLDDFSWTSRLMFDRTRQKITKLDVPAYKDGVAGQNLGNVFYVREGEAIGTFYGFQFAENCGHLPSGVDCSQFQVNDDGFLVWVGDAGSWQNGWDTYTEDGVEKQYWGTQSPYTIGGRPVMWGTPFQGQGIDPITGETATYLPLGSTQPNYRVGFANTISFKGLTLYGLLESVQGFKVYNQPLQWAVFQSYAGIMDQSGVADERLRKPVEYFSTIYGASGLQPSSAFVDDASFIKLRELSLRFTPSRGFVESIPGIRAFEGLTFAATASNLLTWTDYDGYDPDVGRGGGGTGSAAIARVDGYAYPNFRQLTLSVQLDF